MNNVSPFVSDAKQHRIMGAHQSNKSDEDLTAEGN